MLPLNPAKVGVISGLDQGFLDCTVTQRGMQWRAEKRVQGGGAQGGGEQGGGEQGEACRQGPRREECARSGLQGRVCSSTGRGASTVKYLC